MNDLARIIEHMTAAARAGLTPAQCLARDLEQREAFEAWQREVDATKEIADEPLGVSTLDVDLTGAGYAATTEDHVSNRNDGACLRDKVSSMTEESAVMGGSLLRCADAVDADPTLGRPSLPSPDDAFNFAPACRELAAHFMPGADAIGLDYFAQYLMDCAQEYLAAREEMRP